MTPKLLVADLDSPSYFVATAAAELGYFAAEGIDIELERAFGAEVGPKRLRDGTLQSARPMPRPSLFRTATALKYCVRYRNAPTGLWQSALIST